MQQTEVNSYKELFGFGDWLHINSDGNGEFPNEEYPTVIYDIVALDRHCRCHQFCGIEDILNKATPEEVHVDIDLDIFIATVTVQTSFPSGVDELLATLGYLKEIDVDVLDRKVNKEKNYTVSFCIATISPAKFFFALSSMLCRGGG